MAWTTAMDWTTGCLVTAAQLNQQIRDNMNVLRPGGFTIILDNGGVAFSSGTGCSSGSLLGFELSISGSFQEATVITNAASGLQLQLWKDTYANWPPASPTNIFGSSSLTTASANKGTTTLFATACFAAGDWLVPRIIGCSGPTTAFLALKYNRT